MQTKITLNNGDISQYGLSIGMTQSESNDSDFKELKFWFGKYCVISNIDYVFSQEVFTKLSAARKRYKQLIIK